MPLPAQPIAMTNSRTGINMDELRRVYEAFAEGRDSPPSKTYAAPGRLFAELLNAKMKSRLSAEESTVVESGWGGQYRAIVAARKGQIEESKQEVRAVRSVLEAGSLSIEASLLIQVLLDPAEAYLHYKLGDDALARQLVLSGAALNHSLTEEFDYGIISAQRMQLCHNILRINSRQGRRQEAVHLASAYLDYLEFDESPLPAEIDWGWIARSDVPESIVQYYFDQICGEAALALAGTNDGELFQSIARHAGQTKCRAGFAAHAHAWLAAKQTLLADDWANYLEQARELLRLGKTSELSLWFATIIDVISVCSSLGIEGARVAERISVEASQIPNAPWLLQSEAMRS